MGFIPTTPAELDLYLQLFHALQNENYINSAYSPSLNPDENRGQLVFVLSILSMALAFIVVQLRIFSRLRYGVSGLKIDDWMIVAAAIVTLGFTVINTAAVTMGGLGRHLYTLTASNCIIGLKLSYAHQIVYCYAILFTKLSIIFFIRRICAANDAFTRRLCNWFIAIHIMWALASSFTMAFQCQPTKAGWDVWTRLSAPRSCSVASIYYSLTGISVVSDFAMLLLPVKTVWELRLPVGKKLTVLALFGLGGSACICAILRMIYLFRGIQGYDFSWNVTYVIMYGQLETCLAIVTTSLPSLKVIYQNLAPSIRNTLHKEKSGSSSTGASKHGRTESTEKTVSLQATFAGSEPDFDLERGDIEMGKINGHMQEIVG